MAPGSKHEFSEVEVRHCAQFAALTITRLTAAKEVGSASAGRP